MTTLTAAKKTTRLVAAAIAIAGLPLAGLATSAMAQPRPPAAGAAPADHARDHARPNRIEGRIAYLKAELKITPAQETQWSAVADVMRRNATSRQQLWEQMRNRGDTPVTAVDRLNFRQRASEVEAENAKSFATTFAALYTRLDDTQKKQADELMSPRRHRRL
jgi:protein CpxP